MEEEKEYRKIDIPEGIPEEMIPLYLHLMKDEILNYSNIDNECDCHCSHDCSHSSCNEHKHASEQNTAPKEFKWEEATPEERVLIQKQLEERNKYINNLKIQEEEQKEFARKLKEGKELNIFTEIANEKNIDVQDILPTNKKDQMHSLDEMLAKLDTL